jgi:hypothetical protein
MGKSEQAQQREQRLAAKLRENLRRRKDQAKARALGHDAEAQSPATGTDTDKKP